VAKLEQFLIGGAGEIGAVLVAWTVALVVKVTGLLTQVLLEVLGI
jgi:hypothetical protein